MKTPELEKMGKVKDKSQAIGEFLEWASRKGLFLCTYDNDGSLMPSRKGTEVLLAEHFHIDLDKVEKEKRSILKKLQSGSIAILSRHSEQTKP